MSQPAAAETDAKPKSYQRERLVAAVVVALLLLAYSIGSQHIGLLQACSQHPGAGPGTKPVILCSPVSASAAPILLGALVIMLLLLPDFAEIAVPGLLTLKRRVEEQHRRQDRLEQRLEMNMSQTTTITNQNPIVIDAATLRAAAQRVAVEDGDLDIHQDDVQEQGTEPDGVVPPHPETERAQKTVELIERWERLARAAALADTIVRNGPTAGVPADISQALISWSITFAQEREYVRAARNTVAHAQPIDIETLRQAVALAQSLETALPQLPILDDPFGDHFAFESRVYAWLESTGFGPSKSTGAAQADFVGVWGGVPAVVEAKLSRRPVNARTLRAWLLQLGAVATSVSAGKAILAVSAPEFTQEALVYAASSWDFPAELVIYHEAELGRFTALTGDEAAGG